MYLLPGKPATATAPRGWIKIGIIIVFIVGVLIRLLQYAGDISYWMDELFSVVNIERMTLGELLTQQPAYNQVVAPGYYLVQKTLLLLVGYASEMVLRLYPVVCSVVGLFLLYRVALRYLRGPYLLAAVAMLFTGLGSWLYGTSAKPYAVEMLYAVFLTLALLRLQEGPLPDWQYVAIGIVGGIGTFSSLICTAFLVGAVPYLFWTRSAAIPKGKPLLIAGLWIAGALATIGYTQFALDPAVKSAMADAHAYGFPSGGLLAYPAWLVNALYDTLYYFLAINLPLPGFNYLTAALMVLAAIGAYALLRKDPRRGVLLLLFIAMDVALATLYLLPLTSRYGPATFWVFFLFAMYGLDFFREQVPVAPKWLAYGLAILLALPNFTLAAAGLVGLPQEIDPVEQLISEIQRDYQEGQQVLVHPRAYLQMDYYAPQAGLTDYYILHAETTPERLTATLDSLAPTEAWFVVTNVLDYPSELSDAAVREVFEARAEAVRRIELTPDTYAVLYHF
ncbi:dolichyl-phosphate-mannose-protein mannosyltransferase [Neolewinella xylanilytica]|uniref:Dolichyl-phosphate-mannose-protein mannosyltransferase n=1 Tax=Neolewinella xylanilytica TaxID=1514080 RepID=A0A2S6I7F8_9BACT|nr:glycosyltransferase family 39 protein [Neolewinella xylanilytica]PPK87359.1 dolichyl-phosphate-mannose-protein mannosyltransferase [Neolewinella xylanilytica]